MLKKAFGVLLVLRWTTVPSGGLIVSVEHHEFGGRAHAVGRKLRSVSNDAEQFICSDDYLAIERNSPVRHVWIGGGIDPTAKRELFGRSS